MKKGDTELDRLRHFCVVVVTFIDESAPGLGEIREQFVRALEASRSVRGMREVSRDVIEMGLDLSPLQVDELDSRLAGFGLPTFSVMRAKQRREVCQVLVRGRIDSEEEYRLLNVLVSNLDTPDLALSDRTLAERLLSEFEQQEG